MKRKQGATRGYALVEQAAVAAILLSFLVGVFDITKIVQSHRALMEAARTSIRCVYTVDGVCVTADAAASEPIYAVTSTSRNDTPWGPKRQYQGTAYYLLTPRLQTKDFRATVLDSVYFDLAEYDHIAEERRYPAMVSVSPPALKTAAAPFVKGSTPENASFWFKREQGAAYGGRQALSISTIHGRVRPGDSEKYLGSATFKIPSPLMSGQECYRSTAFDRSGGHSPGERCTNEDVRKAEIVLWVRGKARTSAAGSHARVGLTIHGPRLSKDLRGRYFRVESAGGWIQKFLVPRGAPGGYVDDSYTAAELRIHSPIEVLYDEQYTLDFYLSAGTPDAPTIGLTEWQGTNVLIYTPKFETYSIAPTAACRNNVTRSEEARNDLAACNPANIDQVERTSGHKVSITTSSQYSVGETIRLLTSTDQTPLNADAVMSALQQSRRSAIDFAYVGPRANGALQQFSRTCAPNKGVLTPGDPDGFVRSSSEANSACPASAAAQNTRWSEKTVLLHIPAVYWNRENCAVPAIPEAMVPPALRGYPKHDLGVTTAAEGGEGRLYLGKDNDPREAIKAGGRYACASPPYFTAGAEQYNESTPLPSNSLFRGYHFELCNWTEVLRNEAVRSGMNADAYFLPEQSERIEAPLQGHSPNCAPLHYVSSGNGESLYLGQFKKSEIPPVCSASPCQFTLLGFAGAPATKVVRDTSKAEEQFGFAELASIYPKAQFRCSTDGPNCADIRVAANDREVSSTASIEVPLVSPFLWPVFGKTHRLSYTDQRAYEELFVRSDE